MVHYRNRQALGDIPISTETTDHLPKSLDTNLVCMFSDPASQCSDIVNDIKTEVESSILSQEPGYSKYYNFPSCSSVSGDWAERYWGDNLDDLLSIKDAWDPSNLFHHCQSVGSSTGQSCRPNSEAITVTTTLPSNQQSSGCLTTSGEPCVFPFNFQGVSYNGCTTNGGSQPWCSTNTDALGSHMYGYWGNCDTNTCPLV